MGGISIIPLPPQDIPPPLPPPPPNPPNLPPFIIILSSPSYLFHSKRQRNKFIEKINRWYFKYLANRINHKQRSSDIDLFIVKLMIQLIKELKYEDKLTGKVKKTDNHKKKP